MKDLDAYMEWVRTGQRNNWIGPVVCAMHDGVPTSKEEDDEWESGDDPCIHVIRVYRDDDQKASVEKNHPPSRWR